jgi:hypothetical protein
VCGLADDYRRVYVVKRCGRPVAPASEGPDMTVAELIDELKKAPPSMEVKAWDGDYQRYVPVAKVHVEDDELLLDSHP